MIDSDNCSNGQNELMIQICDVYLQSNSLCVVWIY